MEPDDDIFVLPEFEVEHSNTNSSDEVIELDNDSDDIDQEEGEDEEEHALNSTMLSEANSNYCESVTSYNSTVLFTEEENEEDESIIINIENSSSNIDTDDDDDIIDDDDQIFFHSGRNRKRKKSNDDDDDDDENDSCNSNDIIINKTIKKVSRPKIVTFDSEIVNLKCDWMYNIKNNQEQCKFQMINNKYEFMNHVKKHTEDFIILKKDEYQCQWRGCKAVLDATRVVFHIHFHAYHTALKSSGQNTAKLYSMQECTYGTKNVNKFQTRETLRACMWNDCNSIFVDMFSYEVHLDHHMVKYRDKDTNKSIMLPCEWKNCIPKFSTNRRALMLRHLLKHSNLKRLACPTCGTLFKTRFEFKLHCDRKKVDKSLQCSLCKKYFKNESILHEHVQKHVYTKRCPFCQAMCINASSLARHIRHKHLGEAKFKCDTCDFKTITLNQLNNHKNIHLKLSERTRYTCTYSNCNSHFLTKRSVRDHIKSKHEKIRYACHLCNCDYYAALPLTKHLRKKHDLSVPAGSDKFRYRKDKEGKYRLQTVRYESIENDNIPQKILSEPSEKDRYNLNIIQNEQDDCIRVIIDPIES